MSEFFGFLCKQRYGESRGQSSRYEHRRCIGRLFADFDKDRGEHEAKGIGDEFVVDLLDAVAQAIEFEQQTLLFFYALRDLAQPVNRPIIDKIVEEERRHVRQLAALRER